MGGVQAGAAGTAFVGLSLLTGLAAMYWPASSSITASGTAKCPLGFKAHGLDEPVASAGSALPAGHPPVFLGIQTGITPPLKLFTNASIWTGAPEAQWADTIAVRDGRVVAVGAVADVLAQHGLVSEVVDLQGRFVTPGLVDAHVHLTPGGLALLHVDLGGVRSGDAFIAAVKEAAEAVPAGQWVVGGGWNEMLWGGEVPTAAWLDEAAPANPVYLTRMDGHSAVVNSAALRAGGVDDATPDPSQGRILRDAAGAATGVLACALADQRMETAINLVTAQIPAKTLSDLRLALERAAEHLLSRGITTVCDLGRPPFDGRAQSAWEDLEDLLIPAAEAGQLPIRVVSYMPLATWEATAELVRRKNGTSHAGGRVHWGHVKAFHDGSLGSRTALMHEPYSDQPGNAGMRVTPLEQLRAMAAGADAAGLHMAVHAIGDRAVDEVLDLLRDVAANNTSRVAERRHRVEHAQHLSGPEVAAKFAALGAVAVTNPLHLLDDRAAMLQRLGPERSAAGRAFAFRTLQQAGAPQAFGSDWPVVPLDALGGIYAAAHRRAPGSDDMPFEPSERLSLEDALRLHTAEAAHSAFMEHEVGMLRPGLRADFVVYSGNVLEGGEYMPQVLHTYLDGDLVWSSEI